MSDAPQLTDTVTPRSKEAIKRRKEGFGYVVHLFSAIIDGADLKLDEFDWMDVDLSERIAGAMSTLHNFLQKDAAGNISDGEKLRKLRYDLTSEKSSTLGTAIDRFRTVFKGTVDYMVVCPIVNLCTSFKLLKNECRNGLTKLITRKGQKGAPVSIFEYGLNASHTRYLKLASLKPQRRSGLMQCIGTLAHCINLLEDKTYKEETERALRETMKHLPMCEEIIMCMKCNTRRTVGKVLAYLGDLLLITTDRSHATACFPTTSIIRYFLHLDENRYGLKVTEKLASNIDFSGRGAIVFYNTYIGGQKFKWSTKETSSVKSSEIFFHSIFGTYVEDLGILSTITNISNWHTRSEMSDVFKKGENVEFTAPTFKLVSRLISACGTQLMNCPGKMLIGKPVFSGKRKRCFSGELMIALTSNTSTSFNCSVPSLQEALKNAIKAALAMDQQADFKTTEWFDATKVTLGTWGELSGVAVKESDVFFF